MVCLVRLISSDLKEGPLTADGVWLMVVVVVGVEEVVEQVVLVVLGVIELEEVEEVVVV